MNDRTPLLIIDLPCDKAVDWMLERVSYSGLSVLRTFDLREARRSPAICLCPYHGSDPCDCQMVVLLLYLYGHRPLTVIANGYGDQTRFSLIDTPQQRADPQLEAIIRRLVTPPILTNFNLVNNADAI